PRLPRRPRSRPRSDCPRPRRISRRQPSLSGPDPYLVQVRQQVRGILVDPVGAGTLELILAVAARQETDAERAGAVGGEEIPDAVADDDGRGDRYSETLGGRQEEVWIGLGALHLVPRDHGHVRAHRQ